MRTVLRHHPKWGEAPQSDAMEVKYENKEDSKTVIKKKKSSLNGVDSKEEIKRRYAIGNRAAKALKQEKPGTRLVTKVAKV